MFTTTQPILKESLPDSLSSKLQVHPDTSLSKGTGRWTKEEHQRFIEGVKLFGKNWKSVEEYVGTRTGAQIRSHAQKFFNRLEKELNTKGESSHNQNENHITQSIRKISEGSISTDGSLPVEGSESMKTEEAIPSLKNTIMKKNFEPLAHMVSFESPVNQTMFYPESLSVPSDSPKRSSIIELGGFRRNPRKMSEDVIVKQSRSLFDVILSKIRFSKNGIDMPKLSDLVDMNLSSGIKLGDCKLGRESVPKSEMTVKPENNVSFRVNPRKFSEDNILLSNIKAEQLRRASFDHDLSAFELFSKKIKRN